MSEKVEAEVVMDEVSVMEDNKFYIRFDKKYKFEDKEYDGISIDKIEDISGRQLLNIEKKYKKLGGDALVQEMDTKYAIIVAAEVCNLPMEFFYNLPSRELVKVRMRVMGFYFQGASDTE